MLLILVVALIVVGPDRLPELARKLAGALSEIKKTTAELKQSLNAEGAPGQLIEELKPDLEEAARSFQHQLLAGEEEIKTALDPVRESADTLTELAVDLKKEEEAIRSGLKKEVHRQKEHLTATEMPPRQSRNQNLHPPPAAGGEHRER